MEDIARLGLAIESTQVKTAVNELDRLQAQARSVETQADKTTKSFSTMQTGLRALGAAVASVGVAALAAQLSSLADEGIQVSNSLKLVTTSSSELAAMQSKLLALSNNTRTGYAASAELYSKLTRSTEQLGISEERRLRVTELINKSFSASGASAQEADNAIRQLSQGLAAGALRGDEFNSVAENAPEILRAVAVNLGKTTGEVRALAGEGKITGQLLIESLEKYGSTIDRTYSRAGVVTKNYETIARNNAIYEIQNTKLINDSKELYGETLVALSENLGELAEAGTAAGAVLGVYLLGSVVKSTAATIQLAQANAAQAAAQNAAAATALRAATAEKAAATAALATARTQFAAAQGTNAHTFALVALNATKERSLVAMSAYNAALAATTVQTTRLAAVSAFMLGPWGLLITAVGVAAATFLLSKENSAAAAEQFNSDSAAIDKLAESYSRLSNKALQSKIVQNQEQLAAVETEIVQINKQLIEQAQKGSISNLMNAGTILELKERSAELTAEKENLINKQKAINQLFEQGLPAVSSYTNATNMSVPAAREAGKEYLKMRDSLAMQIVELTLSKEAYERYAAGVELGKDATVAERQNIDALIVRLQTLRKEKEDQDKAKVTTTKFEQVQVELVGANNPAAKLKQDLDARLKVADEFRALDSKNEEAALQLKKDAYRVFYEEIETLQNKTKETDLFSTVTESLASLKDQASGTLASVTLGLQDGDDAARTLATTILTQLVGAMINYGIEQAVAYATGAAAAQTAESIKTAAVVSSVSAQAAAASTAQAAVTGTAVASGASIATAMAPAAAATSIATAGAAPAAAAPIALGTIATIIAALVGGFALFGRAQGGQVIAGQTYKFNEKGPELFTPRSAGTVTPFNQLMAEARNGTEGGGDTVYLTVKTEISAIDSSSFEDVISQNSEAVAQAVEKVFNRRGKRIVTR